MNEKLHTTLLIGEHTRAGSRPSTDMALDGMQLIPHEQEFFLRPRTSERQGVRLPGAGADPQAGLALNRNLGPATGGAAGTSRNSGVCTMW